jgi:hypothetical protein
MTPYVYQADVLTLTAEPGCEPSQDDVNDNDQDNEWEHDDESPDNSVVGVFYYDCATDRYHRKSDLAADYDEDMGMSLDLAIPGEEILVTADMVRQAREFCEDDAAADIEMVAAVVEHHNAWDELTLRSIRQGRLTGLGLAGLVLEHLDNLSDKIDQLILYWSRRKDTIAAQRQAIMDRRARVKKDNELLQALKKDATVQSHHLAREQHQDMSASRKSVHQGAPKARQLTSAPAERFKNRMESRRAGPRGSGFSGVRPVHGSASSVAPPQMQSQPETPFRMPNKSKSTISSISPPQHMEPVTPQAERRVSESQVSDGQLNANGDRRKLRDDMGL